MTSGLLHPALTAARILRLARFAIRFTRCINMAQELTNLEQLLDRIEKSAEEKERVSLGEIVRTVGAGKYVIVVVSSVIAVTMPVLELVPFTATAAGAVLTAFGLGLIACDGLLVLFALMLTAAVLGLAVYNLL